MTDPIIKLEWILILIDWLGTFVFAISGAITASKQKMDLFGSGVVAFVTALGGGTLRDVLIDHRPLAWMVDLNYLFLVFLALIITYFFKSFILKLRKTMFLFDTLGLGLFAILGIQRTLEAGYSPIIALMMGTVSASFGGVIRDILCNEVPLIFRKEIYALACLIGGGLFMVLEYLNWAPPITIGTSVVAVIGVRILAIQQNWSLPGFR